VGLSKRETSQTPPVWMVVYVAYNINEASIVAGRLKSEGIAVLVHQETGASALGIHIGGLGEVKVLVRPEDYQTALSILGEDAPQAELPDTTDEVTYHLTDADEDDDE
jgi:hypothetical protein